MSSPTGNTTPSSTKIATDLPLRSGQVLEGKFRIEKIIGEGAMGLVVEATHLALDERVALKFLRREARERPEIVARFAREARASAKIKSDHVARVYDVGATPDGAPFIVMEFLEGSDLERVLERHGRLASLDAVEHVIEACEGLAAAHSHGIIHRDIKPGNLFVSDHGGRRQIKVLDFGISKAGISGTFEDIDVALAQTTQIMGSPHYMSPEQIRSTKDVDRRADVWSLGVVLFELLTGETPFSATDVTGIIAQVLYEPHRSARSLVPEIPEGLEKVIDGCLEKDVTKRYASAADLAVALLPYAPKRARALVERAAAVSTRSTGGSVPIDSYPPPAPGSTTGSSTRSTMAAPISSQAVPLSQRPKKGAVTLLAIACVVIGIVGVCFALLTRRPVSPGADTATTQTEQPSLGGAAPAASSVATNTLEPTPREAVQAARPTAEATTSATAPVRPVQAAGGGRAAPRVAAPPRASASSPPRPRGEGESEIRLER